MNPFYSVFIYPLEFMYKIIYTFCYALTGNYGIGLIVLSCLAAIGYLPLGRLAVKAQAKEKRINAILKPQLDAIKNEEVDGSKRQSEISRLYKKYRYHPILVVRTAFGVILQLPFLLGAYYMISHFTALEGQTFLFISDLSKPDGLLAGINLLPLVMTLINAGTTLITPNLSLKDRIQAFVIAALFLWLLYGAPSALLFFWTTNNSIFFIQNVIIQLKNRKGLQNNAKSPKKIFAPTLKKETVFIMATFFSYVCYVFLIYIKRFLHEAESTSSFQIFQNLPEYIFVLATIIITGFSIKHILSGKKGLASYLKSSFVLISSFVCLCVLLYIHKTLRFYSFGIHQFFFYAIIFAGNILNLLVAYYDNHVKDFFNIFFGRYRKEIFFVNLTTCLVMFFFHNPAVIYASDSAYFTQTILEIYAQLLPFVLFSIGFLIAIYCIPCSFIKNILSVTVTVIALFSALYLFIFKGSYGTLDFNVLSKPIFFTAQQFFLDIASFACVLIIVACIYFFRASKQLALLCQVILFMFGSMTVYYTVTTFTARQAETQHALDQVANLDNAEKLDRFYGLSKTKPNVVVFMFDMFTGGHIEKLLERNPRFYNDLDGFTWYPDTISVGNITFISMPSIYGGYNYSPEKINARNNLLVNEVNLAYSDLANVFSKEKFDCSLNTPKSSFDKNLFYQNIDSDDKVLLFDPSPESSRLYNSLKDNLAIIGIKNLKKYFSLISLFQIAPHYLKYTIYNRLQRASSGSEVSVMSDTAFLDMLSEYANTNQENPTFKFYYNLLSHYPWHLKEKEVQIISDPYPQTLGVSVRVNGIIPEHLFSEEHMLFFIRNYIEKLKEFGVYDNTRIIITSDHDGQDSQMLQATVGEKLFQGIDFIRPHGLLLFKDFKTTGKLTISSDLMTTADTYYLAKKDIFQESENKKQDTNLRYHYLDLFKSTQSKFLYKKYQITGTMFDIKNWKEVQE